MYGLKPVPFKLRLYPRLLDRMNLQFVMNRRGRGRPRYSRSGDRRYILVMVLSRSQFLCNDLTTFSYFAPATRRAVFWARRSSTPWALGASRPTAREAI